MFSYKTAFLTVTPLLFLLSFSACDQGKYREIKGDNLTYSVFEIESPNSKRQGEPQHDIYQVATFSGINRHDWPVSEMSFAVDCGTWTYNCVRTSGPSSFVIKGLGYAAAEDQISNWQPGESRTFSDPRLLSFESAIGSDRAVLLLPGAEGQPVEAKVTLKKKCAARIRSFKGKVVIRNSTGMITLPQWVPASWVEANASCWQPQDEQTFVLSNNEQVEAQAKKQAERQKTDAFIKQQALKRAEDKKAAKQRLADRWQNLQASAQKSIEALNPELVKTNKPFAIEMGALMKAAKIQRIFIEKKCLTYGWKSNYPSQYTPCKVYGESLDVIFDDGEVRNFQGATYLPVAKYYPLFISLTRSAEGLLLIARRPDSTISDQQAEVEMKALIEYLAKNVADGKDRSTWQLPEIESIYRQP